jgi:hypothetical protein
MQDPSKPIWVENEEENKVITINLEEATRLKKNPICIFVATPVHSECSIHYTQSLLTFQLACAQKGIKVSFALLKSSLVTQGRNLCVSNFLEAEDEYSHFLFIDSDIEFKPETIFKMIEADKEVIAAPYPLKAIDWDKIHRRIKKKDMDADTISKMGYTWPIKIENQTEISIDKGVMEVSHAPTGCMLIKKQVFKKMINAYPELEIKQPTIINGIESTKPYYYNFFDTYHEPETKRYFGEDFGFCKRWTEIGGKCYLYVSDDLTHVGEYRYTGNLLVDMRNNLKKID